LFQLIEKYNLAGQVTIHEPCANIADKLLESSIYAFPSRSDGFGLVITEAMECGLPTVAMDCECGPREIVTPQTGIVVPDKDIDAFARALETLIDDEELRCRMGLAAQVEVVRFYPENIMPKWLALFESLVK
jgi:glycosyltransferase involved in cell wall biosynthesis